MLKKLIPGSAVEFNGFFFGSVPPPSFMNIILFNFIKRLSRTDIRVLFDCV